MDSGVSLSEGELSVLKALGELNGEGKPEEIASISGLKVEQVLSHGQTLQAEGLIEISRVEQIFYILTDEGRHYLREGLPERRLLNFLREEGRIGTSIILKRLGEREARIALGWARRRGWIKIEKARNGSIITLTESGEVALNDTWPLERLLETVSSDGDASRLDEEALGEALNRGLVVERSRVRQVFRLTEDGWNVVSGRVEVLLEVRKLTREHIVSGAWRNLKFKAYNVEAEPPRIYPGKKHPYLEFLEEIREILIGMGFVEAKGPLVELEFWNFDALFQAQDHPAREVHDSYRLSYPRFGHLDLDEYVSRVKAAHEDGGDTGSIGWRYPWSFDVARRFMLRSQVTAVSVRALREHPEPPLKVFSIGKVFRPDVLDKTHSMEFMQCDGIVLDEGLNVRHLMGYLRDIAYALGIRRIKFKPGYFPFTEPSVECHAYHPQLGWIEILGSGLFRPEVLIPLGVDYPRVQCLAWGIGIDRLAMIRLGVDDIRMLHTRDLAWLREKSLGDL